MAQHNAAANLLVIFVPSTGSSRTSRPLTANRTILRIPIPMVPDQPLVSADPRYPPGSLLPLPSPNLRLLARREPASYLRPIVRRGFEAVLDFAYDWEKGTTAAQVEAAARSCGSELERYVFISSIAAYGEGLDLREDVPLDPDDFPMPYIQHKASAERALFAMHRDSGFPVTTFRPPFVHGPRQPFYREAFFWDRMLDGRPIILPDGGELLGENLYFGEVLDMQPLTSVVDKAAQVLDLEPTPFDEARRVSFAWYREQPRRPVDYTFEDRLLATA